MRRFKLYRLAPQFQPAPGQKVIDFGYCLARLDVQVVGGLVEHQEVGPVQRQDSQRQQSGRQRGVQLDGHHAVRALQQELRKSAAARPDLDYQGFMGGAGRLGQARKNIARSQKVLSEFSVSHVAGVSS